MVTMVVRSLTHSKSFRVVVGSGVWGLLCLSRGQGREQAAALGTEDEYHVVKRFGGEAKPLPKTGRAEEVTALAAHILVVESRLVAAHTCSAPDAVCVSHRHGCQQAVSALPGDELRPLKVVSIGCGYDGVRSHGGNLDA